MSEIIERALNAILANDKDNPGQVFADLRQMHDLFASVTGISLSGIAGDKDILLKSGKAIGPAQAAHCLMEGTRTATFIRGIHKAIQQLKQQFPGKRLNVLYAGCGPFATLLTPLTLLYRADELAFHLMDINETSLAAAQNLYAHLGLTNYVVSWLNADATVYQTDIQYDLIICEAMQQALKKEPQVAIMQNLIPQLPEHGIFIPKRIEVSAQLLDYNKETEAFFLAGMVPERINLGCIYKIDREEYAGQAAVTFLLPEEAKEFPSLNLMTDICVFADEHLTAYNCSLNLPVRVLDVRSRIGVSITFKYEKGAVPGFKHELN